MTGSEKMEVRRMYQEGVSISELSRRTKQALAAISV
ncbi:hypothetical protein J2S03_003049 [Alicyclobacillus cycloheptanicus]|uniref:Transposase IS30-like HTH domain-containing protein n=1 Tax=Alicyclobacillus cycloheptanicus TaxID=1457 RepID=A0ABT9XM27_9BACL|nr:hypothetical protein [Alicyclobacillus cycloheptanicus]